MGRFLAGRHRGRPLRIEGLLLLFLLQPKLLYAQDHSSSTPFILHAQVQHASDPSAETRPSNIAPNEHGGIVGLDLLIKKGSYPWVQGVIPGTPAKIQGILAGDCLVAVNGETTMNKTATQVDSMISDRPGDKVTLTLLRENRFMTVHLTVAKPESLLPEVQAWLQQH